MEIFIDRFRKIARECKDKIALIDDVSTITYGELDRFTDGIAGELLHRGLQKGEACGILIGRKKEIVIGAIAILKAGGVFVPMDEEYPVSRLDYTLQDAAAKLLLTEKKVLADKRLSFPKDKCLYFSELKNKFKEYKFKESQDCGNIPNMDIAEGDRSMLLYTSGTTGKPKGVIHTQRMLVEADRYFPALSDAGVDFGSNVALATGPSFMATVILEFSAMCNGASLFIVPLATCKDMGSLMTYIELHRISHIFLPSSMAANLAEIYDLHNINIFAGGEKIRNFVRKSRDFNFINTYGSTEIGAVLTCIIQGDEKYVTVGKPAKGLEAKLVDDNFQAVPEGETGLLLLSDDRMSLGYLNLPEMTKEHWVELDGRQWFVIGDRARRLEDGSYVILGRNDTMMKIRGFRVEAGEIQSQVAAAISQLGLSARQSVIACKYFNGSEHLVCYYEADANIDTKRINDIIKEFLPEYMLPDTWVRMTAMPRNANGKVLVKQLPPPVFHYNKLQERCTETERRVVETVCELLNIPDLVSLDENFIQLGGSSILAMRVAAALREQGIMITGSDILRLNKLRDIAAGADVHGEKFWSAEEYIRLQDEFRNKYGAEILHVTPLSLVEQDLVLDYIMYPEMMNRYNVFTLELESLVQKADLQSALDEMQAKNVFLQYSTVFRNVSLWQEIHSTRKLFLDEVDMDTDDPEALYEYVCNHPISLERGYFWLSYHHNKNKRTTLFINSIKGIVSIQQKRYLTMELLSNLQKRYPADGELANWLDILQLTYEKSSDKVEKADTAYYQGSSIAQLNKIIDNAQNSEVPEIMIYSDQPSRKMVFVHTGNTGSDAYYNLAYRIDKDYSFAVIEPYNLYHMDAAIYGIEQLAEKYIEILKRHQPDGPYILGGWCYGGIVAHEMACQLEAAGEQVDYLIMFDSHAIVNESVRKKAKAMTESINREYFETTPLFAEIRQKGMLDAMVENASHVNHDLLVHKPKFFKGRVLYFKPEVTPEAASGGSLEYWQAMQKTKAGNYEYFCNTDLMEIVVTPHEHDLMMDDESLKVIVPEIYKQI